ncbi:hypothetical protein Poly51_13050 [Rubripirellula tenax]|uniref:Uncharacterized protein n=1 Tax=Rubripirellula tenax TaxID=2528015 RepID=A0A5C6FEI8_9BACT|nr:hypothetical protein Poly51_13050 [Rubripirellula tenax]
MNRIASDFTSLSQLVSHLRDGALLLISNDVHDLTLRLGQRRGVLFRHASIPLSSYCRPGLGVL